MIKSHDHDLAELRLGSGHRQKKYKKKNNNKSRVNQEPRSAHGRAVNNQNYRQCKNIVSQCSSCEKGQSFISHEALKMTFSNVLHIFK